MISHIMSPNLVNLIDTISDEEIKLRIKEELFDVPMGELVEFELREWMINGDSSDKIGERL